MRGVAWAVVALGLAGATGAWAQAIGPNSGAVAGKGVLNDHDGHTGTWSVQAVLRNGDFTGTGTVTLAGATVSGPLKAGRSYLENGKCYFEIEQGRDHVGLSGPCTAAGFSGRMSGFIAGESRNGEMQGVLSPAAGAVASAASVAPTGKLTCAYMERMGGVVAGDLQRYELRISNMVSLTLGADGTYRTNAANGRYTKAGATVRLTSGAFAGAVGQLRPDRSGQPAVYFERDENRRPDGTPIVDIATTACTKAR
jgi:hypothetical protein